MNKESPMPTGAMNVLQSVSQRMDLRGLHPPFVLLSCEHEDRKHQLGG